MNCNAEGCIKEAFAKGLCGTHYQRMRRNGTLVIQGTLQERSPEGRVCNGPCKEFKPWSEYYKVRNGHFAQCKPCYRAYQKARRDARRGQEGA
jgi:hypothetical protein